MNRRTITLALVAVSVSSVGVGFAQSKKPVTVTGCLAQGDETNEYSIKDSSGKTYGLMSSKVDLKAHLGHEVTVTGTPVNENEKNEKNEKGSTGKAEESEHLQVTNPKMVSATCK